MTIERAVKKAVALDGVLRAQIGASVLEAPHKVLSSIRAYLIRRANEIAAKNSPWRSLQFTRASKGVWLIAMGPTIDQGDTPDHFHFDSGARLSFGLTLQEDGNKSRLVSFRYQYNLPDGKSPSFLRFDLNRASHENPLTEPLCHLHPGLDAVRLPFSLHRPLEILDRIFFVVDKNL